MEKTNFGDSAEKRQHIVGGNANQYKPYEKQNKGSSTNPKQISIRLLAINPKETISTYQTDTCVPICCCSDL